MTPAGKRILAVLRRRKRLLLAATGVSTAVLVPLFPYAPSCYAHYELTTVESSQLAHRYQEAFTANLELYEVPYISVGRFVLLRFWTWLDDPGSWVLNASNKAVRRFVDEGYGAVREEVPQRVRTLMVESEGVYGRLRLTCPLVEAVAIEGF